MMRCMGAVALLAVAMSAQNAPSTNKEHHLDIPAISREANGSVVSIVMSDKDGHPIAQGSGFLISSDGQVVTNYHVIKSGTSALIKLPDGAFFAIDGVLASDKDRDVAIIKAHGKGFRMLTLGDSNRLQIGEEVVAIGSPLSLESTVSNGIVSGIRTVEEEGGKLLQITAPISPGSSGGPLFNMAGQVVGITTSHLRNGENLNFAIPINDVKPLLNRPNRLSKAQAFPDEAEPVAAEQTNGPSLADTLAWMVRSSADGVGYHEDNFGLFSISSFYIQEHSSCRSFDVTSTIVWHQGAQTGANRFYKNFDLGDVDPNSIEDSSDGIAFRITEDRHAILVIVDVAEDLEHLNSGRLISRKELDAKKDGKFLISDQNYRNRFRKAFKQAVILCGGKLSTF